MFAGQRLDRLLCLFRPTALTVAAAGRLNGFPTRQPAPKGHECHSGKRYHERDARRIRLRRQPG
jgi:hypothetical protein